VVEASAEDEPRTWFGPFHRLESPTQSPTDARQQVCQDQLWGRPPRASDRPSVKAYSGRLPTERSGIEFFTVVPPDPRNPPHRADWSGQRPGVTHEGDFAKIDVLIVKFVSSELK
jgi:hypothetical protein